MKKGKASVTKATNSIGGFSGMGGYKYNEVSGSRCLPTSRGALTKGQGKMSSAHGTNGQSKDNNMNQNAKDAVGSDCRGFRHGIPGEAHARTPVAGHADQPDGHKSLSKGDFGGKR